MYKEAGRQPGIEAQGHAMNINKDLVAASAAPLVLAILAEGDSYGYAIIKRVGELSGGRLRWTDGMLYPVLHRLERLGCVEASWATAETGRRRRYYRITKAGRAYLAIHREQWQAVDATLRGIWRARGALGETPRGAENSEAPAWPGVTTGRIGRFRPRSDAGHAECIVARMQRGCCHGLLTPAPALG